MLAGTHRGHDGLQVCETTVPRSTYKDQSFLRSWPDWNYRILADTYYGPDSSHFHDRVPIALILDVQAKEAAVLRPTQQDQSPWSSWHDPNDHVFARVCRDLDNLESPNHLPPAVSASVNFVLGMDSVMQYSRMSFLSCAVVLGNTELTAWAPFGPSGKSRTLSRLLSPALSQRWCWRWCRRWCWRWCWPVWISWNSASVL